MSTFHPRRLLLATAVASLALPVFAEEHGFLEDASANLNLRNFFFNRNYTNPTKAQGGAQEWTQSFILDAKSGFTQGSVGFGVDVLGLYSLKLDGGRGTGGTNCCRWITMAARRMNSGVSGWRSRRAFPRPK